MFIHNIDPIALSLGPFALRWYGLAYVVGILGAWYLGRWRAKRSLLNNPDNVWHPNEVDNLILYATLGLMLGARFGYILFYDFIYYINDPLSVLKIWQGGMSFHGGLIGITLAVLLFAHRTKRTFFQVADFVAPLAPLGLLAGRLGNFINGELWGGVTSLPWGVVFRGAGNFPRHPSQLYEAALEGLVLGIILWAYSAKPRASGRVCGLFLLGYGCFRFSVEFVRQPDRHLGYLAFDWLTMGQILCIPMIALGVYWLLREGKKTFAHVKASGTKAKPISGRKKAKNSFFSF